jgi:hypothetical protein
MGIIFNLNEILIKIYIMNHVSQKIIVKNSKSNIYL